MEKITTIRSQHRPTCHVCGTAGQPLYAGLRDRVYAAPGDWALVRCPACGLLWLDPMPLADDLLLAYETYYTHETPAPPIPPGARDPRTRLKRGYLAARYGYPGAPLDRLLGALAFAPLAGQSALDYYAMHLPAVPNGRLLEIGFGSGRALRFMKSLGWQVEGVDFDPVAVESARRDGLNVQAGSLFDQKYPDASFDAISMSHVVEHVPDPRAQLAECVRILKPGGRLALVTPNADAYQHRRYGADWFPLEPPRHLHLFSPEALRRLTGEVGLRTHRLFASTRDSAGVAARSQAIRVNGRTPMDPTPDRDAARLKWTLIAWSRVNPWVGDELVYVGRKP